MAQAPPQSAQLVPGAKAPQQEFLAAPGESHVQAHLKTTAWHQLGPPGRLWSLTYSSMSPGTFQEPQTQGSY